MLTKEYDDSACEIVDLDNKLIFTGKLYVYDDYVEVFGNGGYTPILGKGTVVKICINDRKLGMSVIAGTVGLSCQRFVRLTDLKEFADSEKRRYFRLTIDHSATLFCKTPGAADRLAPPTKEIKIRVKDISLCGIQFESELPFEEGDFAEIHMALKNNMKESFNVIVRRVIQKPNGKVGYGCEYRNLSDRTEQQICTFIFSEQQNQIRNSRVRP